MTNREKSVTAVLGEIVPKSKGETVAIRTSTTMVAGAYVIHPCWHAPHAGPDQ